MTMSDLTCIIYTRFGHLTPTLLRNMLYGMAEEFLIDSLQERAVEISDDTVRQAAKHLI